MPPSLPADYDLPSKQVVLSPSPPANPILLSPASFPPTCHPPSFPSPLPLSSLDPPSLSASDWMMLAVLDPEHGKGAL
ncbi:hypothetical protein PBY51_004987 [Eleginops maclovinus]|uniref:Uncharacterized protein n=1 Tax=Eleginops maclovinus TaxID=56733 RepID=A0AAN7X6E6_ELEMC|nr:hypothetical protein PBY51_004987 [Eleginops maclovinus]